MSTKINIYANHDKKIEGSNYCNFGEWLIEKLFKQMGYDTTIYSQHHLPKPGTQSILLAIGGIFNRKYCSPLAKRVKRIHIWGCGYACEPPKRHKVIRNPDPQTFRIHMLRGPRTYDVYKEWLPNNVVIGDPGLLTSRVFEAPERTEKILNTLFYADRNPAIVEGCTQRVSTRLSKKDGSFDEAGVALIKKIASAKFVLSGSLHAMIVAHSFGTPWAPAPKGTCNTATEWKWRDVCGSFGIPAQRLQLCRSYQEGQKWWDSVQDVIRPVTEEWINSILGALPSEF